MTDAKTHRVVNHLIDALPRKERNKMLMLCKPVDIEFGTILYEPEQPIKYAYFPLTAFISLVVTVGDHPPLEMGLIGNEGMLGVTLALGINISPLRAVVQGSGTAMRMSASHIRRNMRDSPSLLHTFNRYLYVLMAQLAQTIACTRFHEVDARLARWLLLTHDRAHADNFHLTHQFLADMLGVQRSAVTIAAGALQKRKLIRYVRGDIKILNRRGLEDASCKCYDAVIEDYAQAFS